MFKIGDRVTIVGGAGLHKNGFAHFIGKHGTITNVSRNLHTPYHVNVDGCPFFSFKYAADCIVNKEQQVLEILRNYENHKTRTTPKDQGNH